MNRAKPGNKGTPISLKLSRQQDGRNVQFEPRQNKRAFEHIVEQIRNRIYKGLLKPGDRLASERELAEQFHTARLAVREAFRVLEESGLISVRKGKMGGAYIREYTEKNMSRTLIERIDDSVPEMEDLMEARACLESIIVSLAIDRITIDDLKALKKNIAETEQMISNGVNSAEVQLRFHLLIARAGRNSTLEMVLRSILNVFGQFLMREFDPPREHVKKHLEEHKRILKTIEKRASEEARKEITNHVKRSVRHFSVQS